MPAGAIARVDVAISSLPVIEGLHSEVRSELDGMKEGAGYVSPAPGCPREEDEGLEACNLLHPVIPLADRNVN